MKDDCLLRYLTGELSAEENAQVEQWRTLSDENQKILEQMYFVLQVSDRLRIMKSVSHNQALQNLKKRIRQKERVARRQFVVRCLQRAAAILFLPVLSLSIWLLLQKNETQISCIEQHVNPGTIAFCQLPDGSKVWLNSGSRLYYPSAFNGKIREVQISGQGYFEVVSNPQQPFVVRRDDSFSLEVLGTSFTLSAYEDEDIIETTLIEGSVRLNLFQNGNLAQRVMKPNEKLIYAQKDGYESIEVMNVDPKYEIAWKDQQLLFKNHSMEKVIRTLERYYNVRFVVKDERIMASEITAKFKNEPLPQVMEYLRLALDIKYRIVPASIENEEIKPGTVEIWK